MSDDDCTSEHHASNECALESNDCALESNDDVPELAKGQIVHRYVNNFHIHEGGQGLKCGNCGAQKICPQCNDTAKKHQCEVCGIFISSNQTSIDHHMRVHTGERPFVCHLCEESFKQSHHLADHHRIHSKTRPYLCDKCGNTFTNQNHLDAHQRSVHSSERNFQCNQCAMAYKLRHNLMAHYRRKHKCGYDCPDCGIRLPTRDAYTNHHTKHVKEKTASESEAGVGNDNTMGKLNDEAERSGS